MIVRGSPIFDISVYYGNQVVKGNGMIHNLISSIIGSDNHREVVHAPLVLYQNPRFEFAKVECCAVPDYLDALQIWKPAEEFSTLL